MASQLKLLLDNQCERLFVEQSAFEEDSELQLLLKSLEKGDVIVVESIAAFGKSLDGLHTILEAVKSKEARLISLAEQVDTEESYPFIDNLNLIYQLIVGYRSEHTKQRLARSKAEGTELGRPALDKQTIEKINRFYHHQKMSMREISERCGVSLGSVHKYINKTVS